MYGNRMWSSEWNQAFDANPHIVYFVRDFHAEDLYENNRLFISADSRYKLYLNGTLLQEGPCKANQLNYYKDPCFLNNQLKDGINHLAIEVLRFPADFSKRNHSVLRTNLPFLYVEGFRDNALSNWLCHINTGVSFRGEDTIPAPLNIIEDVEGSNCVLGWKYLGTEYLSSIGWCTPFSYDFMQMKLSDTPRILKERPIPLMKLTPHELINQGNWKLPLTLPAHTHAEFILDARELMTAYPVLQFSGGAGSRLKILYAESYMQKNSDGKLYKADRTDSSGILIGSEDTYKVFGSGTKEIPEEYAPFWYRTFRFIRIIIDTAEPLTLLNFQYTETGYPLEITEKPLLTDSTMNRIWDISLRTLKRCMHDTYIDCPYYEQLQYAQDSRQQILFTYSISSDDRLARKCMEDFRCSQDSEGMINSCAPALRYHVIPGFSAYYVFMVHDHMEYFHDLKLVKHHLPAIDKVLEFYDNHLTPEGIVGKLGGVNQKQNYWSFIDWTPEWDATTGVPTACLEKNGNITVESLLYILALQTAADLNNAIGHHDTAAEYEQRATQLSHAIRITSLKNTGENKGLLQDGFGVEKYSVHSQVFGILSGVLSQEEGKDALQKTLNNSAYPQCSVSMSFYLFRALEKINCYEWTSDLWEPWKEMIKENLTTCVENHTDKRSDCHGWGALLLYEARKHPEFYCI